MARFDMNTNDPMEDLLRQLRYEAEPETRERILGKAGGAMDDMATSAVAAGRPRIWSITMYTRAGRLALAAAVILIVLGGVTLWPVGDPETSQWWLAPPAAWGQPITESLDKVQTLIYREGSVFVGGYGSTDVSGSWSRWYRTAERQRRDTFYDETPVSTMWQVPNDANSVVCYDVSFEYECYTVGTYASNGVPRDPVEMLRFYVRRLDQADRVLETKTIEGKECTGFEISASKYGDNPEHWIDRIWFDTETKLPVRIEHHGRPVTDHPEETSTRVKDEFEYYVDVPVEKFEPQIPEGFVNAHPDTIRMARELEEKGEVVFANVPEGLKDRLVGALNEVGVVTCREAGQVRVYLSRYAWRRDRFDGNDLAVTEWYVIKQKDETPTDLDFNDESFQLVYTHVDYQARTFNVVVYGRDHRPKHPMDGIRSVIGYVDLADRMLDDRIIEGIECFGLELSARKYGSNPDDMIHRLWFSSETDLPVRMELEFVSESSGKKVVVAQDQFVWDPDLPADTFIPVIPEGFTDAHPDEIPAASEQ
jgi:outer membrane lipoprotein-sorting protein